MFGIIGSILSGALGVGSSIAGGISRKRQSEEQRRLNQLQMEREDNAVQRHVADLQAAGLNKQVAAGGQGAASSPIQAPNDAGQAESVMEQAALATKAITESIEETKSNAALAEAEALLAEQRAEAQRIQNELNIARTNSIGVGDQYTAARTAGEKQRQEMEKTAEQRRNELHLMLQDREARQAVSDELMQELKRSSIKNLDLRSVHQQIMNMMASNEYDYSTSWAGNLERYLKTSGMALGQVTDVLDALSGFNPFSLIGNLFKGGS